MIKINILLRTTVILILTGISSNLNMENKFYKIKMKYLERLVIIITKMTLNQEIISNKTHNFLQSFVNKNVKIKI